MAFRTALAILGAMRTLVATRARRLATQPPLTILALGVGYVLTLAALDLHTPPTLDFTLLYLLGVGCVAWGAGPWHATVLAGCSTAVVLLDEFLTGGPRPNGWILVWNEATRFLVFTAAGWLIATASNLIRRLSSLVEAGTARARAEADQHKATAARLAQKELLYRTLFELSPDGILLEDGNGNILDANRAICQISGYSLEELLQQNVRRFVLPEKHPEVERHLAALRAGQSLTHEVWNVRRDGRPCLLELHEKPIVLPDGQQGILVVAHDITQRKKEQEALQLSQHQLAEAMDLAQLVNWEYDVATGLFTFDDRFFRLYATSAEREGGQQMSPETYVREFLYPEDGPLVFNEVKQSLATTDPHYTVQVEHRIRRRDGETRHLLVRVALTKDAAGRTVKTHGVNQDITERKRLERQLVEISDREQARIGQDLHDGLCQQLVSLAFDANALERQLTASRQPEAATARRIATFLDQAITEARQLSRGLFPIRLAAHGLPSALEELASTTRDRSRIPCLFVSENPVALPGEAMATHLFRIAQEAVSNALKHAQPKLILIELRLRATMLELRVEDDGIGMAEPPRSRTGMGLHIMDYRARSIGGTLRVAPGARGGTTVTCCLSLPPA